jgi:hypothetical protein
MDRKMAEMEKDPLFFKKKWKKILGIVEIKKNMHSYQASSIHWPYDIRKK